MTKPSAVPAALATQGFNDAYFIMHTNRTDNKKLTGVSKMLRRNMTEEEKHLWYDYLKNLPQTIHRQKVIGNYIVDFYCAEAKLVIELDGTQHRTKQGMQDDFLRDTFLNNLGITVVRYSNLDILENFSGVCADIKSKIDSFSKRSTL